MTSRAYTLSHSREHIGQLDQVLECATAVVVVAQVALYDSGLTLVNLSVENLTQRRRKE